MYRNILFLSIGLGAFFLVAVFGMANAGMEMYAPMPMLSDTAQDTPMSGCLFTGIFHSSTSCEMGAFAHIAAWQNMFVSVPTENNTLTILLLLLAAVLGALSVHTRHAAFLPRYYSERGDNTTRHAHYLRHRFKQRSLTAFSIRRFLTFVFSAARVRTRVRARGTLLPVLSIFIYKYSMETESQREQPQRHCDRIFPCRSPLSLQALLLRGQSI